MITLSLYELGVIGFLFTLLVALTRWTVHRTVIKAIDDFKVTLETVKERIINVEKDLLVKEASIRESMMSKEEGFKVISVIDKRLEKNTEAIEKLQITMTELTLLIKELREQFKDFKHHDSE